MRISKDEFQNLLHTLDAQRSCTVELYAVVGEKVDPDKLWIISDFTEEGEEYRNAVAQASYYNGHTNMLDALLRQMEPRRFLCVKGNKHYIEKAEE